MGQIGHSEYSLKISQSVRKRQTGLQDNVLKQGDHTSTLILNQTTSEPFNDIPNGYICDNCGSSMITLDRKGNFVAGQFCSEIPECLLGVTSASPLNDSIDAQKLVASFRQVLSFIKLPFHNRSWLYGSVRFPVWENAYSDYFDRVQYIHRICCGLDWARLRLIDVVLLPSVYMSKIVWSKCTHCYNNLPKYNLCYKEYIQVYIHIVTIALDIISFYLWQ